MSIPSIRRIPWRALVFAWLVIPAGLTSLDAQTIDWKSNTSGSWFDPANWNGGQVPTAANNVAIENNGNVSVPFNTGTAGYGAELNVGVIGTGTLNIVSGGGIIATIGYIGNVDNADGSIIVNGGGSQLTLSNNLHVGQGGRGTLDINAGGAVSNDYGKIGVESSGTGAVSVAGATSSWTNTASILVGESGQGELAISAGALVTSTQGLLGYLAGGQGKVSVAGTNSRWHLRSNLFVGTSGTGQMDISSGGAVASDLSSSETSSAYIGHQATGTGGVTVNGVGSSWTIKNDLTIGRQGVGDLFLSNQGVISNDFASIGASATGRGHVSVNGSGSVWTNNSDLTIGNSGTGTLSVIEGGSVLSRSGYLGSLGTGMGEASIDGSGSLWANSSLLVIGGQGSGTLHITSGGLVSNTDGTVGQDNGVFLGSVNVNGLNSRWSNSGDLNVGDDGSGLLNIASSGSVDNTDASLGVGVTGNGEVNVLGAATLWTTRGILHVGESGTGKMNVTTGATATSNAAELGSASTGEGEITITGAGSDWQVASSLDVGLSGTGKLNVTSGGQVSSASAALGSNGTGSGELNLSGDGSAWTVTNTLSIGAAGVGALNMTGGSVSDASAILGAQAGAFGTATIFSGTWSHSGTLTIGSSGTGILNLTGDGLVTVGETFSGEVVLASANGSTGTLNIGAGDTVGRLQAASVTGGDGLATVSFNHSGSSSFLPTLAGNLSVTKSGLGTTTFAAANSYTGTTSVLDGSLKVANASGSATGSGELYLGSSGFLIGDGAISGSVDVHGGIAPGDASVGTLSTGSQTWENGGSYEWDIQNLSGEWDLLAIDGNLSIESLLADPFTIALKTLTLAGEAGLLADFSESQNYLWTIATVSLEIFDWTSSQITLDTSGFANEHIGTFSLTKSGQDLNLLYTVPEPGSLALLGLGLGLAAWRSRQRTVGRR